MPPGLKITFVLCLFVLGCGGGGPSTPPTAPTINSVTPIGDIGYVTDAITFTADIDGTVTAYQWNFKGGFSLTASDAAAPAGTLDAAGSFSGSLVACNGSACSDPFTFTYVAAPSVPPVVTAIGPLRSDWQVGEWVQLDADVEGLVEAIDWQVTTPDDSDLDLNDDTLLALPLELANVGEFTVTVIASNRFGSSPPFVVVFQAAPHPAIAATSFDFNALVIPAAHPAFVWNHGSRVGVVWSNAILGEQDYVFVSRTDRPTSAADFVSITIPANMHEVMDAKVSLGHLVLLGNTATGTVLVAVAKQVAETFPSTYHVYELPIRSNKVQLAVGSGGLAIVPRFVHNLTGNGAAVGVTTNPLPLAASDWRTGVFPSFHKSGPLDFRATIDGNILHLFRMTGPSNNQVGLHEFLEENDATLENLTLSLDQIPTERDNWQVGQILLVDRQDPVGGMPFIGEAPGGKMVLPVSRGGRMLLASPLVDRPVAPSDWEFTPAIAGPPSLDLHPRPSINPPHSASMLGQLAFLAGSDGKQCAVYFDQHHAGISNSPYVAATFVPGASGDVGRLTTREITCNAKVVLPGSDTTTTIGTPLGVAFVQDQIRILSLIQTTITPPAPLTKTVESELRITYLDWPTP